MNLKFNTLSILFLVFPFCLEAKTVVITQTTNYIVTDFEDGLIGNTKVIWGAGSCNVNNNTYISNTNSSSKVLSVTNNAWVPVTIPASLPQGKTWDDYQSVRIKFCLTEGNDLSWPNIAIGLCSGDWGMDEIGSTNSGWSDGTLGVWYTVEVPIDKTKLDNYLLNNSNPNYLIIKYNKDAGNNFLLDDVELVPVENQLFTNQIDFEDVENPATGWYSTSVSIVENPYKSGINTSSKTLKIIDDGSNQYGGAISINILPSSDNWNKYKSIDFKFAAADEGALSKWLSVNVGVGPNYWDSGTSIYGKNTINVTTVGKWYQISIPISNLVDITKASNPYIQIAYGAAGSTYYIDDIELVSNIDEVFVESTDNLWNNSGNWLSANIPDNNKNVSVSTGHLIISENKVVHLLNLEPFAKVTVQTGNSLTATGIILNSDLNGTSTFVNKGAATITSANVQQYLTTGRNWYISSPVTTANTTELSSATSVVSYNEPTASWIIETGLLTPMKGYISTSTKTDGSVTFTGTLNDGDISVQLSRTYGVSKSGFNLVGNPYPSYVNWDEAIKSNLEPTIWYRTKNAGNTAYVFDTYNAEANIGTGNNGEQVNAHIPPMQAFWVRVKAGVLAHDTVGTLSFSNAMRSHKDGSDIRMKASAIQNVTQQVLRLKVSNGENSDETIVLFNANATNGLDGYDSPKMTNANASIPEIYTTGGADNLVVNGLNSIGSMTELPLGFTTGQTNTFSIKATELTNFDGVKIYLRDNLLAVETDLTNEEAYIFNSDATKNNSRFTLIFKSAAVATGLKKAILSNVHLMTNENMQIVIRSSEEFSLNDKIEVYNTVGQKLASEHLIGSNTVLHKNFSVGVYLVILNVNGEDKIQKIILK